MEKKDIRKQVFRQRNEITAEKIREDSHLICQKIIQMDGFKEAGCLYAYMDSKGEVCTEELIREAWKQGKRVAVPKVVGKNIEFYYIHNFKDVAPGYWDIPEPVSGESANEEEAILIVPGVAFDAERHRCGYGKGFYDRYLSAHNRHVTIGIAFDFQIVRQVPCDAHDVLPMQVVTPTVIY